MQLGKVRINRYLLALCAGVVAACSVGAVSAATLGTIEPPPLGVSTQVVASCQTVSALTFTWGSSTFSTSAGTGSAPAFTVNEVSIGNVESDATGCRGRTYSIVVGDAAGIPLASESGAMANGSTTLVTFGTAFDVGQAKNLTLSVYG